MTTSRRREILPGVRAWRCPKSSSPRKRPPLMWGFQGHGGGARVEVGPRRTAEGAWPPGRWYVSKRKSWCEDASASRYLRLLRLSDSWPTRNLQLLTLRQVLTATHAAPSPCPLSALGSRPPHERASSLGERPQAQNPATSCNPDNSSLQISPPLAISRCKRRGELNRGCKRWAKLCRAPSCAKREVPATGLKPPGASVGEKTT